MFPDLENLHSSVATDRCPHRRTPVRNRGRLSANTDNCPHSRTTIAAPNGADATRALVYGTPAGLDGAKPPVPDGFVRRMTLVRMISETMAIERALHLNISEGLFRLVTESIRLFSNRQMKCSSISDVVNERAPVAASISAHYKPKSLQEHLRIIPTEGDVELELTILETSATAINGSIADLEKLIGSSVSFAAAVSLVLFDYVVEENRTEVINKLGLNIGDAAAFREAAKRSDTNVVPFR